jgi:hypothetical protein
VETLVASRRSGSDVMGGLLGSLGTSAGCSAVGSCSTQVEQKMLRSASGRPDLLVRAFWASAGVASGGRAAWRRVGLSLSASAVASIMCPTALAASPEQITTTTTPSTQKYFLM